MAMLPGIELADELRRCIARNARDVVIVVGAGVTIGALRGSPFAAMTSWQGLLHAALDHVARLGLRGAEELAAIRRQLEGDEPRLWIDAAELIVEALGGAEGGELRAWLRQSVGAFSGEIREREVLEALRELHARGAILATVNYDSLLEEITGQRAVTWRDQAQVERVIRGDEAGILHLHGHWEEPESLVFGAGSYGAVVRDEHARAVLQALRMTRTLVLVGHGAGLRDPNWGPFLGWMEQVFARSEYRHYRLVREEECERVQTEHPPAQRITALVYGHTHGELGPFLRSLIPARARGESVSSRSEGEVGAPTPRTVVLRLNIGDKEFDWLSEEAIRAQVLRVFHDSEPLVLPEVRRPVDRQAISPREWRGMARDLDALVGVARAALPEGTPVRYVVAGQAPLPAFAYLGQLMRRMSGPITTINRRQGSAVWDVVGPMNGVAAGRDLFKVKKPKLGREQRGTVVLSIRCSNEYPYKEEMIEPIISEGGGHLLCSYEIVNKDTSHQKTPMEAGELAVLLNHVQAATAWMKERCAQLGGLVVAIGGPSWVAFWVGHSLYPYALADRIDFPNLIGRDGRRYVRALSFPMHSAPWLAGKARLLFVGAEPDNSARTRGAKAVGSIEKALERELGRERETYELRVLGAATVEEFMRELDIYRPDILHMHLHGTTADDGGLVFEDERGDRKPVPEKALVELLRSTNVMPTLVVLSACHSVQIAPQLAGIAESIVYMSGAVGYKTMVDFASAFYGALARGRPLTTAIAQGKSKIFAQYGKAENEQIGWWCAQGVDADHVVLLPNRQGR